MSDTRQDVRKILGDVARSIDRRLAIEVREVPGGERLQVALTHGTHHGQTEVAIPAVLAAVDDAVARTELRLRMKRAADTMLFRPMPNHRLAPVKAVPPPGGQMSFRGGAPRGRGRR